MPPAPFAGNAVTGTGDQARAPETRAPALVTRGHGPRNARTLPRRAARRALTAVPAARSDRTGGARAAIRGDRLRRAARLLRQVPTTGGSYHDPLFERPDLVEDDYYRFRNRPRG